MPSAPVVAGARPGAVTVAPAIGSDVAASVTVPADRPGLDVDPGVHANVSSDRWDALGVLDDQQVVAGWRDVAVRRCGHGQAAPARRERQWDVALVLVEGVGRRGVTDQGDRRDRRRVRRRHAEARAVADRRRRGRDRGSRTLEEVRGRVDLGSQSSRGLAPGDDDASVVEEHGRRVVHPRLGHRRDRRPALGRRVPDLRIQHGLRFVVRGARPAQRDGGAVGQDGQVHPAAREGERRHRAPGRRAAVHVDERDVTEGRVPTAGAQDDARLEHHGRLGVAVGRVAVRRSGRPASGAARRQRCRRRARAGLEDLPVGQDEHQRVQALGPRRPGQDRPGIRRSGRRSPGSAHASRREHRPRSQAPVRRAGSYWWRTSAGTSSRRPASRSSTTDRTAP